MNLEQQISETRRDIERLQSIIQSLGDTTQTDYGAVRNMQSAAGTERVRLERQEKALIKQYNKRYEGGE